MMQIPRHVARRLRPPPFLCQPDSVLTRDHAAERQDLREQFIQSALRSFPHSGITIVTLRHDVHVNVPVSGMTKTRDRES